MSTTFSELHCQDIRSNEQCFSRQGCLVRVPLRSGARARLLLVAAKQHSSIRIQDFTKVAMARRFPGLAKERLAPFELQVPSLTPMIVHVHFMAVPLSP